MNYVIRQGDTIAKVAKAHGIRPFDLLLFNRELGSESNYLEPGKTVTIPYVDSKQKHERLTQAEVEFGPVDLERECEHLLNLDAVINTIGHTPMGKPIYSFSLGHGEKEVFYSGGWHANEWHTSKFLYRFLLECAAALREDQPLYGYDLTQIFSGITLTVVPMVNPDGIELVQQGVYPKHPFYEDVLTINKGVRRFEHWSSNIRGVDLNHQWPAGWQQEADESPQQPWCRHYSGPAPLSEPEAQAVYRLTKQHSFSHVLAFHSQGQVIYWGYRGLEPKESEAMVERLSLKSSYTPVRTADSDGGYKDWFIQETGRPGFTVEVGVGTNPLPNEAFAEIWSNSILLALEGLTL